MNSKENLRPMPKSFNRSKQDFGAQGWGNMGTNISNSVDAGYLQDMANTQQSIGGKLNRLLQGFKP